MNLETVDITIHKGIQAINIPKNMAIKDKKVFLKRVGNSIYIIPFNNPWQNLFESLDLFTSDFMEERKNDEIQIREDFD